MRLCGEFERQGTLLGHGRLYVLGLLGHDDPIARGRVIKAEWRVELLAELDRQRLHAVEQ